MATGRQARAVSGSLRARLHFGLFHTASRLALAAFERRTKDAHRVNREALRAILTRNRDTEFGRAHGFGKIVRQKDPVALYQRRLPLSTYSDYERCVERIAHGACNVLTADPVYMLAGTAGTSDVPKRIPRTMRAQRHHLRLVVLAGQAVINRGIAGAAAPRRGINLMSYWAPRPAAGEAVPVLSGPNAGMARLHRHIPLLWCSPPAVYGLGHPPSAMYLHALFGLLERTALYIGTPFASQLVAWFSLMERHQQRLVRDIRDGSLSPHLELSAAERSAIAAKLRPDPGRAAEVEVEFARGFEALIPRLWPGMKYLRTVTSGSFALSVPRLRWLAGADLPIQSGCYSSSEGLIGINLRADGTTDYVLACGSAFFEFIPLNQTAAQLPEVLEPQDLQSGQEYEVVLTSCAGLYRYRLSDVVQVTGWHGTAPLLRYRYRCGALLNLVGEKTTEFHTARALAATMRRWHGMSHRLKDYSVAGEIGDGVGWYTFYVELTDPPAMSPVDLARAAAALDTALCECNPCYLHNGQRAERLAPAQLKLVRPGTFAALAGRRLERSPSAPAGQIKTPRVVTDPGQLALLEANVLL
jgi:hypothetical protein